MDIGLVCIRKAACFQRSNRFGSVPSHLRIDWRIRGAVKSSVVLEAELEVVALTVRIYIFLQCAFRPEKERVLTELNKPNHNAWYVDVNSMRGPLVTRRASKDSPEASDGETISPS
jgi:hypothetical protein